MEINGDLINGNVRDIIVNSIKTKNMFDARTYVQSMNINSSGQYISDDYVTTGVHYVEVEAGKTYTLSSNINRQWVYNFSSAVPVLNGQGSSRVVTSGYSVTFTVPSGYTYFCVRTLPQNNEDNISQNVQLELGSTATSYSLFQNLDYKSSIHNQGANARGRYIRYSNGILLQWGYVALSAEESKFNKPYGNLYYNNQYTQWTYPVPFYSATIFAYGTAFFRGGLGTFCISSPPSTTMCEGYLMHASSYDFGQNGTRNGWVGCFFVAIGTWR